MERSSRIGRYLIATKDIPAGTVVLRDTAFPVPNYNTDLPQVLCAACCKVLSATRFTQCSLCGWPVCGDACGGGPGHRRECAAFQRAGFKLAKCELQGNHKLIWRALGALKTHFGTLEHSWLRDLQSDYVHDASDKELGAELDAKRSGWRTAARWLRGALGLLWLEEEDLVRAAARNDINAIGGVYGVVTQPTDPAALADTGAIFAGLSLLEHNCTPSCSASSNGVVDTFSTDDFPNPAESVIKSFEGQKGRADNFVTTTRLVRKGEHLSIDYLDDPLISTSVRRKRLRNWGFRCDCERCTDRSEFGLYLESACCASCSAKGSRHFLIFNEVKKIFICEGCGHEEVEDPAWIEQLAFSALLDKPDTGVVELQRFVERSVWPRGPLHATHSLVIEAKSTMVQFARPDHLLGAGGTPDQKILELLSTACRDLLSALDMSGQGLCARRCNLLNPLIFAMKIHLLADLKPLVMDGKYFGAMTAYAPRVRELEKLTKELRQMLPPGPGPEKILFEKVHMAELDFLLSVTGCKLPSPDALSNMRSFLELHA